MIDRIEKSACTSVMVGKKASLNGSTFIARNEDRLVAIYPKRFLIQPAVSGRKEVYKSTYNKLEVPLPESGYRYSSTPNVTMEDGINEEDGFNEKGVGESATESVYANERVLACDPYNKNGLAEDSMTTLVLPFINSAREGVQYLGKLIAKYAATSKARQDASQGRNSCTILPLPTMPNFIPRSSFSWPEARPGGRGGAPPGGKARGAFRRGGPPPGRG